MTLEGRMGTLDVLYTGSYLDRQVNQLVDYSGYGNVGAYLPYYICNYLSTTAPSYSACGNADVLVELDDQNERTTHEFRIASNENSELPFSYTAGVFIDESILMTINEYNYNGAISPEGQDSYALYQENCPIPGAWARDESCRPAQTRFYNDIMRTEEQTSFFGEVTFPVSDKLDFMIGMRKYDMDIDFRGQSKFGYRIALILLVGFVGIQFVPTDLNQSDTVTKFTASYKPDEDTFMVFHKI